MVRTRFSKKAQKKELPETNWFVIKCYPDEDTAHITEKPKLNWKINNWATGQIIDAKQIPQPLIYKIESNDEGKMLPFFMEAIPLIRDDLLQLLLDNGVDNIDVYGAEIHEESTGKIYKNYKAFNIIGLVKAADLAESAYETSELNSGEPALDTLFLKLVINELAVSDLKLFRLEESATTILISKNIKEKIEASGVEMLSFIHPADYFG